MPQELFDSRYFAGQGPLFLGTRDAAGKPAGLVFIGDVGEVSLTPNVENSDVKENATATRAIASSINTGTEYNLSITMRSIKPDHLAIALQGAVTTKAASSATDEPHIAHEDKFIRLLHTKVSAVVVTSDPTGTTFTVNTDYIVHAAEGMIEILASGTIAEDAPLLIDYAYAAQHHISANPGNTERYLVFAGKNSADNDKQPRCEIYKVRLDPGVLGLIGSEQQEVSITGRVLVDMLRTAGDRFFAWKTED